MKNEKNIFMLYKSKYTMEYTVIIITLIIILFVIQLLNMKENFMLINSNKIHKSDQYYDFKYLKNLNTYGKGYKKEKDFSVYDESIKKHYNNTTYLY